MPRAKKQDVPAVTEGEAEPAGSEEVMVVLPAADEPVRLGGHILTDQGWVVEDALVSESADDEQAPDPAPDPDPEQE